MRQIVLDTETTGIGHDTGHRIIEIGCVELIERKLTGKHFHFYLNPERDIDEGAFRVHGISREFLHDKPLFQEIADDFLQFIEHAELIIHNAPFDLGFLNAELKRAKYQQSIEASNQIFDTLVFARKKHPGQRNSLDALCKRYEVSHFNRQLHGALLDAEILAYVYLAMTGGQASLFVEEHTLDADVISAVNVSNDVLHSQSSICAATPDELDAHANFTQFLVEKSGVNHWEE